MKVPNGRSTHPDWCSPSHCTAAAGGRHESLPTTVTGPRGKAPRVMVWLIAAENGPIRLRFVVIGDLLVNDVILDLDGGALLAARITKLIERAAPAT